jgi:hypothetical protein
VLCEGNADTAFLEALRDLRGLGAFDLPFPPRLPQPQGEDLLYGVHGFGNMLRELARQAQLDPTLRRRFKGVVIVADAGNSIAATLRLVKKQCQGAGFGAPSKAGEWTASSPPYPPVAVMFVPHSGTVGLESLCLEYLRPKHPAASACLDTFLACVPPVRRSKEKQDKAALACLVAAIEPKDPTMTIARAFSGSSPLVDVTDPIFTPFADALTGILAGVKSG